MIYEQLYLYKYMNINDEDDEYQSGSQQQQDKWLGKKQASQMLISIVERQQRERQMLQFEKQLKKTLNRINIKHKNQLITVKNHYETKLSAVEMTQAQYKTTIDKLINKMRKLEDVTTQHIRELKIAENSNTQITQKLYQQIEKLQVKHYQQQRKSHNKIHLLQKDLQAISAEKQTVRDRLRYFEDQMKILEAQVKRKQKNYVEQLQQHKYDSNKDKTKIIEIQKDLKELRQRYFTTIASYQKDIANLQKQLKNVVINHTNAISVLQSQVIITQNQKRTISLQIQQISRQLRQQMRISILNKENQISIIKQHLQQLMSQLHNTTQNLNNKQQTLQSARRVIKDKQQIQNGLKSNVFQLLLQKKRQIDTIAKQNDSIKQYIGQIKLLGNQLNEGKASMKDQLLLFQRRLANKQQQHIAQRNLLSNQLSKEKAVTLSMKQQLQFLSMSLANKQRQHQHITSIYNKLQHQTAQLQSENLKINNKNKSMSNALNILQLEKQTLLKKDQQQKSKYLILQNQVNKLLELVQAKNKQINNINNSINRLQIKSTQNIATLRQSMEKLLVQAQREIKLLVQQKQSIQLKMKQYMIERSQYIEKIKTLHLQNQKMHSKESIYLSQLTQKTILIQQNLINDAHRAKEFQNLQQLINNLKNAQFIHLSSISSLQNQLKEKTNAAHNLNEINKQLDNKNRQLRLMNQTLQKRLQYYNSEYTRVVTNHNVLVDKYNPLLRAHNARQRLKYQSYGTQSDEKNRNQQGFQTEIPIEDLPFGSVLFVTGKSTIEVNKKAEDHYFIGIIANKDLNKYYTHQFVEGSMANLIVPLLNLQLKPPLNGLKIIIPFGYQPDAKTNPGVGGRGFQPGIIIDKYKGNLFVGLRMLNYIKNQLIPTKIGFNLLYEQFKVFLDKLKEYFHQI